MNDRDNNKEKPSSSSGGPTWAEVEALGRNTASVGGIYEAKYSENAGRGGHDTTSSPTTIEVQICYETRPFSPVACHQLFPPGNSDSKITITNVVPAPEISIITPTESTCSSFSSFAPGSKLKSKRTKERSERCKKW